MPLAPAQTAATGSSQTASAAFFEAYYLEHERGDLEAALALYERVAEGRGSAELRKAARKHGRALAEELAASDFARLVPEDTIFYLEFNSPGEQLKSLLGQLGLLGGEIGAEGGGGIGISPLLIDGLLGMRGAAVALTQIDPTGGPPNGVLILHPGDLDVIRGLIETALPVGGQPVDSIGGFPTYSVEGEAFITLTSRLVVASPDRRQIEGVISRLSGRGGDSLAANEDLASTLSMRGEDLVFFCLNLEPIMPMVMSLIQAETGGDPQVRAALAFLDLGSTRSIAGRLGVDADGISFDMALELAEGHKNLAFNLLRMPNIDADTLTMVPEGVAFFAAGALNHAGPMPPGATDASGQPVVTLMDFGREVFANVSDFSLYALPQVSQTPWGPMPEVALALRVNDPERSLALWNMVLGLAQAATTGKPEVVAVRSGEVTVTRYDIQGVPVILASHGNDMIISPSERAIEASIEARRAGRTVLNDPAYAAVLANFRDGNVRATAFNLGRCSEIASHFMSERERREMMPFAKMLSDTSVSFSFQQTANRLGVSARVCGIPNVGPMVSQLVAQQMGHGQQSWAGVAQAQARTQPARTQPARTQPVRAQSVRSREVAGLAALGYASDAAEGEGLKKVAYSRDDMEGKFAKLHRQGKVEAAGKVVRAIQAGDDDPFFLNNFAWALLTEEQYDAKYDALALDMSKRSNELSDWSNWFYLDTYGTALFRQGRFDEAVKVQRQAVETGQGHERIGEAEDNLERFIEAAAKARKAGKEAPKAHDEKTSHVEAKKKKVDGAAGADMSELMETFEKLNDGGHRAEALHFAKELFGLAEDDANSLNTFAWNLLTEERFGNQYDELAIEMSKVSNELTDWGNWFYLDTYAHALFQQGRLEQAIEMEKKAIEVARGQNAERIDEAIEALKRFEKAAKGKQPIIVGGGAR